MDTVINICKWIVSFFLLCISIYILDKNYPDLCWAVGLGFIGFKMFESTLPKYERYEFSFQSGNKSARIEIGQNNELTLTDVLEAVKDILITGGFTYVDEVRAVNYGERQNKIFSSNPEDSMWNEEIEVPVPEDDGFREVKHETVVLNSEEEPTANVFDNQY